MTKNLRLVCVVATTVAFGFMAAEAAGADRKQTGDKLEREMQVCVKDAKKLDRNSSTRLIKQVEICFNRAFAGYDKLFRELGGGQLGSAANGDKEDLVFAIEKAQSLRFLCSDFQPPSGQIYVDGFEQGSVSAWLSSCGDYLKGYQTR